MWVSYRENGVSYRVFLGQPVTPITSKPKKTALKIDFIELFAFFQKMRSVTFCGEEP